MDKIMVSIESVKDENVLDLIDNIDNSSIWGYATYKIEVYAGILKAGYKCLLIPGPTKEPTIIQYHGLGITKFMSEVLLITWTKETIEADESEYEGLHSSVLEDLKNRGCNYAICFPFMLNYIKEMPFEKICKIVDPSNIDYTKNNFDYILVDGSKDNLGEMIDYINNQFS